ncbi:MAG: FAD-dependent oxidoreductase [Tannerellaceae bacterium]|jgi:ribulose 1,5-bisphosphate synthetase/thiazole synthase|nr:FAD-dependent oxidoreductase [Tannerellaceae bacterium]
MKELIRSTLCSFILLTIISCSRSDEKQTDVLIIGGGASGITAGIQSARLGVNTLIVEESEWLGGMLTSAGVSATDGNHFLQGGLWKEFRQHLENYYGGSDALATGWVSHTLFEPSVGNKIFHEMAAQKPNLSIQKQTVVKNVTRSSGSWIVEVIYKGKPQTISAKRLIDATELGDIAKACGAGYDIGMESKHDTRESVAPGEKNNIIQDITYVAILKEYGKDVTIPRPANYDPAEFACCCDNNQCVSPKEPHRVWSKDMMLTYGKLPNNKYMINWPIEGNDYYVNILEMTPQERIEALKGAKERTIRFVYFIQHELGFNTLGLADDEYSTADKLPYIPYHRESRRIHGEVRFTLNHVVDPYGTDNTYRTCIAVGDYPVDHHHTCYEGNEDIPDLYFHPIPSFGLPLGTLIPKDVDGLIVAEKSISVSNIINGSTRLQPVVLEIGQAAGILAALSVCKNIEVREVSVRDVQNVLLKANGYLFPYRDVPVSHPAFKVYQRIGSTGILKGVGKSVDWSNETWFRADTVLVTSELSGLEEFYPGTGKLLKSLGSTLTLNDAVGLIDKVMELAGLPGAGSVQSKVSEMWKQFDMGEFRPERKIKRGEMALLIDQALDPFNKKPINIQGEIIK